MYGSVRGAARKGGPYRDPRRSPLHLARLRGPLGGCAGVSLGFRFSPAIEHKLFRQTAATGDVAKSEKSPVAAQHSVDVPPKSVRLDSARMPTISIPV